MDPEKKYSLALLKTVFTHLCLLGLLLAGLLVYSIHYNISIMTIILKYNNPFTYYINLVIFLIIGMIYFITAKNEDEI